MSFPVSGFVQDIKAHLTPKLTQVIPTKVEEKKLKPISLLEMITYERVFVGSYIDLTIIDDPELKFELI